MSSRGGPSGEEGDWLNKLGVVLGRLFKEFKLYPLNSYTKGHSLVKHGYPKKRSPNSLIGLIVGRMHRDRVKISVLLLVVHYKVALFAQTGKLAKPFVGNMAFILTACVSFAISGINK